MSKPLLLRPKHKCIGAQQAFLQAGINIECLPLITIQSIPSAIDALKLTLTAAKAPLRVIVTSTSAAELMGAIEPLPNQHLYVCVGASSASILRARKVNVDWPQQQNSEGLISLIEQQNVSVAGNILVKGEGGRTLLPDYLNSNKPAMTNYNIYKRIPISVNVDELTWKYHDIECIISTSIEQIELIFQVLDHDWLQSMPWVVVSQRALELTQQLGVTKVICSQGARNAQLIQAVNMIRSTT